MTDQPAPDVTDDDRRLAREWAASIIRTPRTSLPMETAAARAILHAVPAAPRPTLADMTPRERAACKWMQADIIGGDEPLVITRIDRTDGTALILDRNGRLDGVPAGHVTPRPDLPRMTWPGDQQPAPAPALPDGWMLADHPRYGRVLVTTPEPDCDGDLWFIDPSADPGSMEHWCDPDVLTFLDDQGADQ